MTIAECQSKDGGQNHGGNRSTKFIRILYCINFNNMGDLPVNECGYQFKLKKIRAEELSIHR